MPTSIQSWLSASTFFGSIEMKDLFYDDLSMAFGAWEVSIVDSEKGVLFETILDVIDVFVLESNFW